MNKVIVSKSNIGLTDDFTTKFFLLTDEDFINTDLVDLFKYLGFLFVCKNNNQLDQALVTKQTDSILNAIQFKDDQDIYLDLTDFGKGNLIVSFAVKNKYSINPVVSLKDLLGRFPSLFDYVKLDLPNILPVDLQPLVDNQFITVNSKVTSKMKETSEDINALEELK